MALNAGALHGYPGTQLNQATITAPIGTIDPLPANNLAQATVTILVNISLGITKTNAVSELTAGQTTSYAITAFNDGSAAADGSIVRDFVSAGLGWAKLVCTSVSCSASSSAICPVAPISLAALQRSGVTRDTFPASSNLVSTVICGVTATGQ